MTSQRSSLFLLNAQSGVGRGTPKSPVVRQENALSLQKSSLKLNTASHHASWHTDTDEFLAHSASWGSLYFKGHTLQKIILGFFLVPPSTKSTGDCASGHSLTCCFTCKIRIVSTSELWELNGEMKSVHPPHRSLTPALCTALTPVRMCGCTGTRLLQVM